MAISISVEEVDALAGSLSLSDQQRLIQQVQVRIEQAERVAQVEQLIQRLRDNALPGDGIDAAEAIQQIREERMAQLCLNDA